MFLTRLSTQGMYSEGAQRYGGYHDGDLVLMNFFPGTVLGLHKNSQDPEILAECRRWSELLSRDEPIHVAFDNIFTAAEQRQLEEVSIVCRQHLCHRGSSKCSDQNWLRGHASRCEVGHYC